MINLLATHITPAAQLAAWAAAHPLLESLLVAAILAPMWALVCCGLGDLIGKAWIAIDEHKAAKSSCGELSGEPYQLAPATAKRAQRPKKGPQNESCEAS